MRRRRKQAGSGATLATAVVVALAAAPLQAADRAPTPDDELLEFLGSVDAGGDDGDDWLDFLSSTDVDKVAKRRRKAPVTPKDQE
ncbi:MAG: hypothetical protein U1F11_06660 [Steroidobacteraceae bacterium]